MALSETHRQINLISSFVVLVLGLFLTVMGCMWLKMEADQESSLYFDRYTEKLHAGVAQRFARVLGSFEALRAHIHADDGVVRRDAFRIWVASRRLLDDTSGLRGIGFIQHTDRAGLALRDNSTLLNTLNRFNLMSVADANGIIIDVNDAFCLVTGYRRDELLGKRHQVLNSDEHDEAFWAQMWQAISHGEPWNGDVCDRARDGTTLWLKTTVVPLKDARGHIEKYLSIRS